VKRRIYAFGRVPSQAALIVMLALLVIWFSLGSPYFLSLRNVSNILISVSVLGILSLPLTILLIQRQFDLSVASGAALCGMILALTSTDYGLPVGIAAAMLTGLAIGLLNGALVAWVGINSIIATLGTLSIFRGLTKVISNGQTIRMDGFTFLGSGTLLYVPVSVILFGLIAFLFWFVTRYTVFGRNVYAIGANPEAARLAGIRVQATAFVSFVIAGVLAGLAGLILTSQLRAASPVAALGLELSAVAAVVLGGTSLSGGRGSIVGTILGLLVLGVVDNGLIMLNMSSFWQEVARGVVLVLAVGFDQLRARLSR
jgi:ribose transport system permease protein